MPSTKDSGFVPLICQNTRYTDSTTRLPICLPGDPCLVNNRSEGDDTVEKVRRPPNFSGWGSIDQHQTESGRHLGSEVFAPSWPMTHTTSLFRRPHRLAPEGRARGLTSLHRHQYEARDDLGLATALPCHCCLLTEAAANAVVLSWVVRFSRIGHSPKCALGWSTEAGPFL